MSTLKKKRNEKHESLCEELQREKAAVLSRAGFAVDDAIRRLNILEQEIESKLSLLTAFNHREHTHEIKLERQSICKEINLSIDKFNTVREKAQLQYYYLIVTREALGLRRHEMIQEIYRIPEKKKKVRTP
jgi:hypothetical protein